MHGRRQRSPFRRILVGFDGSAQAEKAAETAFSLAQVMDARVILLAVARPAEPATSVELSAMLDDAREHYEQAFIKLQARAQQQEVELETEIAVGHPPRNRLFGERRRTASTLFFLAAGVCRDLRSGSWDRSRNACCATRIVR